ncbi:Ribosomal RNA small subunit methyltransferase H [Maioricimonas rarisocia]|uniref:Ribosomal RNA small subunit methyltransferase H n=1 Tax=Maioricimonas rarisocia TaxID=2528026 RepID=A0A517Z5Y6_9PLAN|nr:16S rRNA (cytosine(1402)-N(4))-methyltransferase RsmH [Maioricimonas rarisocia]QDU37864.1 Ribosomal RNA small subunit methyltransferase H [Maioricimonas rarisocia]
MSDQPDATVHIPVMPREVIELLDLSPGLVVVDGTVGGGGHSRLILEQIGSEGMLVGLDRDNSMLARARQQVSGDNCQLVQSSYADLPDVLEHLQIEAADRVLVDLGLSSDQLADRSRGFGFAAGGPLDLRFDPSQGQPAGELLLSAGADRLEQIFRDYGEEPNAARIARAIVDRRRKEPVRTAEALADLIADAVGRGGRSGTHPATRVFQALRIAVNEELDHLQRFLEATLPACLRPGGRAVVITFHSLEDRIVKNAFRDRDRWELVNRKPMTATAAETRRNPRSRSAKVRAATLR